MSNRSKKSSVPEAQSALNRFKFEVASELVYHCLRDIMGI